MSGVKATLFLLQIGYKGEKMTVKTTKINNAPCIIGDDILLFDPNGGLKNYDNTMLGSFSYPSGDKPCSIMINEGKDIFSYACHGWLGFPETVIYRYKDGKFGIGKYKNTTEIPNRENVLWAFGGLGLMDKYNPAEEGFSKFTKDGKSYNYSDVLRTTDHNMLGIKDGKCYLLYMANMSGSQVNEFAKSYGFDMAVMGDGGHLASLNGSESYAKINTSTKQGYAVQAISSPTCPIQPQKPQVDTTVSHTVKKGDSLSKIAKIYGIPYKTIATNNNIKAPLYIVRVGQVLKIK